MNKDGVTLVELVVALIIFALVTVFLGKQLNQMTRGFIGGRNSALLQTDTRDLLTVMARDIRNTGFKRNNNSIVAGTFIPYSDSSSFIHKEGGFSETH